MNIRKQIIAIMQDGNWVTGDGRRAMIPIDLLNELLGTDIHHDPMSSIDQTTWDTGLVTDPDWEDSESI